VVNGNRLRKTRISSLATYVPPTILDNHRLSQMVDTTDEWILQRTGIGRATSSTRRGDVGFGKEAALKAVANAA